MSSVNDFLNAISIAGASRQHKWSVRVSFPAQIATTDTMRKIDLFARSATTPASTLGDLSIRAYGRNVPYPGDRTFEDFNLTILSTNDYAARAAFESWSELCNGSESNTGLVSLVDMMADVELDLLDANDNTVKTYILKDAYVSNVSGSELDRASENTTMDFTVTFKYLNYITDTTR